MICYSTSCCFHYLILLLLLSYEKRWTNIYNYVDYVPDPFAIHRYSIQSFQYWRIFQNWEQHEFYWCANNNQICIIPMILIFDHIHIAFEAVFHFIFGFIENGITFVIGDRSLPFHHSSKFSVFPLRKSFSAIVFSHRRCCVYDRCWIIFSE